MKAFENSPIPPDVLEQMVKERDDDMVAHMTEFMKTATTEDVAKLKASLKRVMEAGKL